MAGTSFLKAGDAGKLRFGAELVNLVGDRTQPGGLATTGFDDEGVKAERWHLVRDGMFVGLADHARAGAARSGSSDRTAACTPTAGRACRSRACRTSRSQPAATEVSLDDLFSGIKRGLFVEGRGSSSIDQQRYNFQFGGAVIREITNGKLGAMVRDAAYQSRTPDFWASCDGLGGPATYRLWGTSADGKGEPGQTNAVSHGCPPARFRQVTVLNTAGGMMLDRDEALKICETVLAHAQGGGRRGRERVAAELGRVARALRRQPHHAPAAAPKTSTSPPPSGSGGGAARRRGTTLAPDALQRLARRSGADRARVAGPPGIRPDARRRLSTREDRGLRGRDRRYRRDRPRDGAQTVLGGLPRRAKVTGAGFHSAQAAAVATATANGNRRYFQSTDAGLSVTARSADGTGSGYYAGDHYDLARLDTAHIAERGGRQGGAVAANRNRSSPAAYPVDPRAAGGRRPGRIPGQQLRRQTADEGRSAFSAKDGKTRVGETAVQRAA